MSKLIPTLFLHFEVELTDSKAELREICWYTDHLAPWPLDQQKLMKHLGGL